jgi:protein O-mannosyl-transferase
MAAYLAALSHPNPSARLLSMYGDYAWNVLDDRDLGKRMAEQAVIVAPGEAAYRITLIRMLVALGQTSDAMHGYRQLALMNVGGRLNEELKSLLTMIDAPSSPISTTKP